MFNPKPNNLKPLQKSLALLKYESEQCEQDHNQSMKISSHIDKEIEYVRYARECGQQIDDCLQAVQAYRFPEAVSIMQKAKGEYDSVVLRTVEQAHRESSAALRTSKAAIARIQSLQELTQQRIKQIKRLGKAYSKNELSIDEGQYLMEIAKASGGRSPYTANLDIQERRANLIGQAREDFNRWREENEVERIATRRVVWSFSPWSVQAHIVSEQFYRLIDGIHSNGYTKANVKDQSAGTYLSAFSSTDLGIPSGFGEEAAYVINSDSLKIIQRAEPLRPNNEYQI